MNIERFFFNILNCSRNSYSEFPVIYLTKLLLMDTEIVYDLLVITNTFTINIFGKCKYFGTGGIRSHIYPWLYFKSVSVLIYVSV